MSRVGFKKIIAAGNFTSGALSTLKADIKTYIVNAGFAVLTNNANEIDFMQAGFGAAEYGDDIPRWYVGTSSAIAPQAYLGPDFLDMATEFSGNAASLNFDAGLPEIVIHFAADGAQGWWWLHVAKEDNAQASGYTHHFGVGGATSRRYPADNHQGLCNRYGILGMTGTDAGVWFPPVLLDDTGAAVAGSVDVVAWSPLTGEGYGFARKRHTGSPLPKMAVPLYPCASSWGGITAFVLGELNEFMVLTDGYSLGEVIAPGWAALVGQDGAWALAALAPDTFTVL